MGVDAGVPGEHPVRHDLGDAGGLRHPHRLGAPEAVDVRRRAQHRAAVRREGEDAVELVLQIQALHRGEDATHLLTGEREVLRGEPTLGRVLAGGQHVGGVGEVGRVQRQRAVLVGTDADPVAELAEIDAGTLMTDDGPGGFLRP